MFNFFLTIVLFVSIFGCQATSKIYFENQQFEKEVKIYLKELKKAQPEIKSIIVASAQEGDSVFIRLSNAYPDITLMKAYANYEGIDFCFAEIHPLKGFYKVKNSSSSPEWLKSKYEEFRQGKHLGEYEPFTRYLTFYKGRLETHR